MCNIPSKNWKGFSSNVVLALKIMNFANVILAKVVHFYVVKNMNA
jgi:hypothetical protein